MANKKALRLIELGLHPVLWEASDDLKRRCSKAGKRPYTPEDDPLATPRITWAFAVAASETAVLSSFSTSMKKPGVFPPGCTRRTAEERRLVAPAVGHCHQRPGCHVYFFTERTSRLDLSRSPAPWLRMRQTAVSDCSNSLRHWEPVARWFGRQPPSQRPTLPV